MLMCLGRKRSSYAHKWLVFLLRVVMFYTILVWLTLKWTDFQMGMYFASLILLIFCLLVWNPVNYGGIKEIRVSPDKVWLPDIVLFNNADGKYGNFLRTLRNYLLSLRLYKFPIFRSLVYV